MADRSHAEDENEQEALYIDISAETIEVFDLTEDSDVEVISIADTEALSEFKSSLETPKAKKMWMMKRLVENEGDVMMDILMEANEWHNNSSNPGLQASKQVHDPLNIDVPMEIETTSCEEASILSDMSRAIPDTIYEGLPNINSAAMFFDTSSSAEITCEWGKTPELTLGKSHLDLLKLFENDEQDDGHKNEMVQSSINDQNDSDDVMLFKELLDDSDEKGSVLQGDEAKKINDESLKWLFKLNFVDER